MFNRFGEELFNMTNHKNSFFIKEGPREVDFDIDGVFLQHSVNGKIISLRSEEIKDLLDEKLLQLDCSLKQRHGELVDYLKKVEGRISRVEGEILGRSLSSLEELDNSNLKTMNLMNFQNDTNVKDNEFGELVRKENNLPNVSLDQEELDALLEGLNEISRDNKKSFSSSNKSDNDADIGISFDKTLEDESSSVNIDHTLSSNAESNTRNVVDSLSNKKDKEDIEPVGIDFTPSQDNDLFSESSSFGLANVVNGDDSKVQDLVTNLDGDDKILREPIVDQSSVNVDLEVKNSAHLGNFVLDEEFSNVESVEEENVSSYEQDNLRDHNYSLGDSLNKIEYLDKSLEDLNSEQFKEEDEDLSNFNDIAIHEIDSVDINLSDDASLRKRDAVVDNGSLRQNQEIDNISSGLKKLDNFEDVLKADLNCVDLQCCIEDFEEDNLYDAEVSDLEEKLEQDEELNLYSLKGQEIRDDNYASDFSFSDVETIINKFNDNDYLSKIKLSDKERVALISFISKLESDLAFSPKGNSFKIKKEYEILQKIKRLLVRE
ncbi:hypothetical protein [Borrelia parkeri]|uniref:hypothetical protein n=1 Tax=Borrelia parkeri TaxID=141 RepID=UPI001F5274D0|nr:hypothetical protein [Borrelia parkeri]